MLKKRLLPTIRAICILSILSIMPTVAQAASVIFNNITPSSDGFDSIYGSVSNVTPGPSPLGISFTGTNANLIEVQLLLALDPGGDGNSTGTVTVELFSDSGNEPGSFIQTIGTVNDTALLQTFAAVGFSSFAPYALTAGTRYWINVTADSSSTAVWSYSGDLSGTGVSGEYLRSYGSTYPNSVGADYQAKITTDQTEVVPEPDTIALLSLGLVGIAFGKRRKLS